VSGGTPTPIDFPPACQSGRDQLTGQHRQVELPQPRRVRDHVVFDHPVGPVTYALLRGPAGPAPDFGAFARYRTLFDGPLIANPDLVSRFALGHELTTSDRATHYAGGARGYVDYPIWSTT
jgi:hypothetical protein